MEGPLRATPSTQYTLGTYNLSGVQGNFRTLSALFLTWAQHGHGGPVKAIVHKGQRSHGILAYLSYLEQPDCDEFFVTLPPIYLRNLQPPRSTGEF
jgi:hypothetical protein